MRRALAIFAKLPSSGQVKTRLKPELKSTQIAELYHCFIKDTIVLAKKYNFLKLFLYIWPAESLSEFAVYNTGQLTILPQEGSDLGERLYNCFVSLFEEGYQQVGVISVDSPNLPDYIIPSAYQILEENDLVIGPAQDGGYYMIAASKVNPNLFTGIEWSTERVFQQTTVQAVRSGFNVGLLPEWYDIDKYADLKKLKNDIAEGNKINQNIPKKTMEFISKYVE